MAGLNWKQFERGILRPWMDKVEVILPTRIGSSIEPEQAVKIVGETLWHESDKLQALGQYPRPNNLNWRGPGNGISSYEEPTWNWIEPLFSRVAPLITQYPIEFKYTYDQLSWNLAFNVIAARLRYYVDRHFLPLPSLGIEGRAEYWFRVYNGSGVAARKAKYISDAKVIPWE